MIVAIDGPAGAGKSSVARGVARRLGFRYLDTGAMYRALTWLALRDGVSLDDESLLGRLADEHPISFDGEGRVEVDGVDVSDAIRTPGIDAAVPVVARHVPVRERMRSRQRALADTGDSVLEGRDIGAVVVPHAEVKVWLDADPAERARRRHAERPVEGVDRTEAGIRRRDERDAANTHLAPDAVVIDTTSLTLDEVVDRVEALARERMPS